MDSVVVTSGCMPTSTFTAVALVVLPAASLATAVSERMEPGVLGMSQGTVYIGRLDDETPGTVAVPTSVPSSNITTLAMAALSSATALMLTVVASVTTSHAAGSMISAVGGTVSVTEPTRTGCETVSCPDESMATAVITKMRLPLPTGGTQRPR